ncbi:PEPxxWA-CTERM sorting domain-containing protein [Phenylobacterium sp.]|uniref:PEPxxWA-CTERM sorting domain-containing protein n=1 Tax=Phenylobacterium sp. TaxID=1871053 RepID=UPI00120FE063|nr:PEPxxWA-CTERM sorting domain-containing protein [Phenylobacterium sp.]THD65046.1 MAG: PEP-CTERM sorting domain-containing protein [Phenylobacterium sp.]
MRLLSGLILAAATLAAPAFADTVVVAPGGAGDAQGPAPLRYYGSGGGQVEQIYASSFFAGPTEITGISFRAYPGSAPGFFTGNSVTVSDLDVQLSSTAVSANEASGLQPSTTFAANLGANATTVFSGAATLTTAATGTGPQPFDYTLTFTTPFAYNPASGNLLLDFLIPSTATVSGSGFGFLTFDNANDNNDGVRSIVNISDGASATGALDTSAAITEFHTTGFANVGGGVPEPASWALMILGFGLTGGALRARQASRVQGPSPA